MDALCCFDCLTERLNNLLGFVECLWCVDAVCASFAVIFNGGSSCFIATSLTIDGFVFTFSCSQESASLGGSRLVILKKRDENMKIILLLWF